MNLSSTFLASMLTVNSCLSPDNPSIEEADNRVITRVQMNAIVTLSTLPKLRTKTRRNEIEEALNTSRR